MRDQRVRRIESSKNGAPKHVNAVEGRVLEGGIRGRGEGPAHSTGLLRRNERRPPT